MSIHYKMIAGEFREAIMINRDFFFDHVRATRFTGRLTQNQVDGLTHILDVWEADHAKEDDRWLAYALGTAYHETAFTMQPINEFGGNGYFFKMYDIGGSRPAKARELGNTHAGDGVLFHGRGYVQLTGRANYDRMGTHFGVDLTGGTAAAERVMEAGLAAKIMFYGMETGLFTTHKLAEFFHDNVSDWKNARKIINGLDCADKIAVYAKDFYAAVSYTK
jgi:putative chitinase